MSNEIPFFLFQRFNGFPSLEISHWKFDPLDSNVERKEIARFRLIQTSEQLTSKVLDLDHLISLATNIRILLRMWLCIKAVVAVTVAFSNCSYVFAATCSCPHLITVLILLILWLRCAILTTRTLYSNLIYLHLCVCTISIRMQNLQSQPVINLTRTPTPTPTGYTIKS